MKKKSFVGGALVLIMAGLLSKVIGVVFRVPLVNMIGTEGFGIYYYPFVLYATMLSISVVGIPVAISRLVSERIILDRHDEAHRVFKVSFYLMLAVGIASSFILWLSVPFLTTYVWPESSYYSLMGLVFAPFFVALLSAFRGYFQGMQRMVATASSQIFESLGRLIFGLGAASLLINKGVEYAAGGASFGATAGGAVGLVSVIVIYIRMKPEINRNIALTPKSVKVDSNKKIVKSILSISIPISIGAVAGSLMMFADSLLIPFRLKSAGYTESQASDMFGEIGICNTFINLALTISVAIAISLVPAITQAHVKKNHREVKRKLNLGIKMGLYVAIPAAIGLFVLADPILALVFSNVSGAGLVLKYLSVALIFLTLNQIYTACIQGMGKVYVPVYNLIIGGLVKMTLTYILVGITKINVIGAVISTIVGYFIASTLNYMYLKKHAKLKINVYMTLGVPLLSGLLMGVSVHNAYKYLSSPLGSSLATVASILVGVLVYGSLLLVLGGIDKNMLQEVLKKKK